MKKFLNFKYLLILIIAILGIFILINYKFNIQNSKTFSTLNSLKDNYTLSYEIDINEKRQYTLYCQDEYYCEYSFYEYNKPNYMKQEEKNGVKTLEIKGIDTDGNFFNQNSSLPLQTSNKTNAYIYTNKLASYFSSIEKLQYYKVGYKTIENTKYYFEEFKLTNNNNLVFYYLNNDLKIIQGTNLIDWININLISGKNDDLLEKAENKFSSLQQ